MCLIARGKGTQERQPEQAREMQAAHTSYIQPVAGGTSATDQIASAKGLLDSGAITHGMRLGGVRASASIG